MRPSEMFFGTIARTVGRQLADQAEQSDGSATRPAAAREVQRARRPPRQGAPCLASGDELPGSMTKFVLKPFTKSEEEPFAARSRIEGGPPGGSRISTRHLHAWTRSFAADSACFVALSWVGTSETRAPWGIVSNCLLDIGEC